MAITTYPMCNILSGSAATKAGTTPISGVTAFPKPVMLVNQYGVTIPATSTGTSIRPTLGQLYPLGRT
jgi:hypothetical protein